MVSKHNMALINDCGMIATNFGDSVEDVKKGQNRPDCMGINERLSYAVESKNPLIMAKAFKNAVVSGRNAFLAGRMKKNYFAIPSTSNDGLI